MTSMSPSSRQRGRQQFGNVFLAQLLSAGLQAVTWLLLAREAAIGDVGTFIAGFVAATVAIGAADCGLSSLAMRDFSRDDESMRASAALRAHLFTTATAAILCAATAIVLGAPVVWSATAVCWIWSETRLSAHLAHAIPLGKSGLHISTRLISRLGTISGLLLMLQFTDTDVITAVSGAGALSSILALLYCRAALPPSPLTVRNAELLAALIAARPFWIANISGQVRTLDTAVVGMAAGSAAAAAYGLPARLVSPLRMAAASLTAVSIPAAARSDDNGILEARRLLALLTACTGLVAATVVLSAEHLVQLTLGAKYSSAVMPLQVLLIGVVFAVPGSFHSGILQARGDEWFVERLGLILGSSALVCYLMGALLWGAPGVAGAVTLTNLVQYLAVKLRLRHLGVPH